jgi:hypothetical protein
MAIDRTTIRLTRLFIGDLLTKSGRCYYAGLGYATVFARFFTGDQEVRRCVFYE